MRGRPGRPDTRNMNEELIQVLALAARIACRAVTSSGRAALQASVDQACSIPPGFGWERKAAAHAEFFTTLADAAEDPCAAPVLNHGAGFAYDLMIGAGRAADGMVISCRRRMLIHLRAGQPDQASREMEKHLQTLCFMNRLATSLSRASALSAKPGPRRPSPLGTIIFLLNGRCFYLSGSGVSVHDGEVLDRQLRRRQSNVRGVAGSSGTDWELNDVSSGGVFAFRHQSVRTRMRLPDMADR
jgi:hypothetical protein